MIPYQYRPLLLSTALTFSAACGKNSATEPDGQVQGAYGKIATALCERHFACVQENSGLRYWANVTDCANDEIRELSLFGSTSCEDETDYTADASDLATCIDSLAKTSCERLQEGPLLYAARVGLLPDCLSAAEQLADAEANRLWSDKSAPGESCRRDDDCTWDAYCTGEPQSCGVCKRYPQPGESCMDDQDAGRLICGLGVICTLEDMKCVDHLPRQGEACGSVGECDVGLDCNDQLKCAKMHAAGDACDSETDDCGRWLNCAAGKCVGPGNIAKADTVCSDDCAGGRCVDGRCSEYPDLDEACEDDCLEPYVCVDGVCAAIPECATGAPGEVCSKDTQCQPGLACSYDDTAGQDICTPRTGGSGEPCRGDGTCTEGRCTEGVCTLLPEGAACDPAAHQCERGKCEVGRCTPEPSCE